jgi:exodeoxyribonuclease VII small subunit
MARTSSGDSRNPAVRAHLAAGSRFLHELQQIKMTKEERPSFEEALTKLEAIVEKLDDDDITLEESVQLYEEGLKLSKICSKTLENAELKIEEIEKKK